MNKRKMDYRSWMWIFLLLVVFTLGLWFGFVLHESLMFKGAVMIAEGLEGTTFNIEVDFNETEISKEVIKWFNETIIEEEKGR